MISYAESSESEFTSGNFSADHTSDSLLEHHRGRSVVIRTLSRLSEVTFVEVLHEADFVSVD